MERESGASVPARLIATIEQHHEELLRCELLRRAGKAGYNRVPGSSWRFPDDQERPSAEDIAQVIYDEAAARFGPDNEEPRFRAVLYLPPQGEDRKPFEVPVDFQVEPDAQRSGRSEEAGQHTFVRELTRHFSQLYRSNERVIRAVAGVVEEQAKVLPGLLQLRMDAMEDRAEAILEGLGAPKKKTRVEGEKGPWDDTAKSVNTMIETFGPVFAAKAFGMSEEEVKAYMPDDLKGEGKSANDSSSAPAPTEGVRGVLVNLGKSLTQAQQGQLMLKLGKHAAEIMAIAKLDSEPIAAKRAAALMDAMAEDRDESGKCKLDVLEEILSDKQADFVDDLAAAIEQAMKER